MHNCINTKNTIFDITFNYIFFIYAFFIIIDIFINYIYIGSRSFTVTTFYIVITFFYYYFIYNYSHLLSPPRLTPSSRD